VPIVNVFGSMTRSRVESACSKMGAEMPFRCTSIPETGKAASSFRDSVTAGRRLVPMMLTGYGNPSVVTIEGSMRVIRGPALSALQPTASSTTARQRRMDFTEFCRGERSLSAALQRKGFASPVRSLARCEWCNELVRPSRPVRASSMSGATCVETKFLCRPKRSVGQWAPTRSTWKWSIRLARSPA
jgi:hypothetical protein